MEEKKKKANTNSGSKKKPKINKKYSLCFPFHLNYKILKDKNIITQLIYNIQGIKASSFIFGLNSTLNICQKSNDNEKLIILFYKEKMESLYDILLFRTKNIKNIYIYLVDDEYQKKFCEIFKLKKMLSFTLLKDKLNEKIFNEINNILSSYNLNDNINRKVSNINIQEITIESKNI